MINKFSLKKVIMKKVLMTLGFVAMLGVASMAQDRTQQQQRDTTNNSAGLFLAIPSLNDAKASASS